MSNEEPLLTKKQDSLRFTKSQLAAAYGISIPTLTKMIGPTPPVGTRRNAHVWAIGDVTEMRDVRDPYVPQQQEEKPIETDPAKMKPADRKTHYQAEDYKQSTMLKERKNAVESRELLPAQEVEITLANAFKTVALVLDTLPDALERDGIISSTDIAKVVNIIDGTRDQLATDLAELSPIVEDINEAQIWDEDLELEVIDDAEVVEVIEGELVDDENEDPQARLNRMLGISQ